MFINNRKKDIKMQTYQIQINDNIADNILWFLNSFKDDVKIQKIDKKRESFEKRVKKSIKDIENGRVSDFDETIMFSNHSANCIEEWKNSSEDSVWK